jgi:hypothetical protein
MWNDINAYLIAFSCAVAVVRITQLVFMWLERREDIFIEGEDK